MNPTILGIAAAIFTYMYMKDKSAAIKWAMAIGLLTPPLMAYILRRLQGPATLPEIVSDAVAQTAQTVPSPRGDYYSMEDTVQQRLSELGLDGNGNDVPSRTPAMPAHRVTTPSHGMGGISASGPARFAAHPQQYHQIPQPDTDARYQEWQNSREAPYITPIGTSYPVTAGPADLSVPTMGQDFYEEK